MAAGTYWGSDCDDTPDLLPRSLAFSGRLSTTAIISAQPCHCQLFVLILHNPSRRGGVS